MGYDRDAVERLAADMAAGDFLFTGDEQIPAPEGGLLDGQRRLQLQALWEAEGRPMSDEAITAFVSAVTAFAGERETVIQVLVARWLRDRELFAEQARDQLYDDQLNDAERNGE